MRIVVTLNNSYKSMYVNVNTVCEATGALKISWTEFSSTITMFFEWTNSSNYIQILQKTCEHTLIVFVLFWLKHYPVWTFSSDSTMFSFFLFRWFKWTMSDDNFDVSTKSGFFNWKLVWIFQRKTSSLQITLVSNLPH